MTKRLISFFLTLILLAAIPLSAAYKYNPFTRKLDYYLAAPDIDLGDLGDITLTGLANGDVLYYNGTAWVNLGIGGAATVLTVAAGIPSWQAAGAPAAHAASHEVAGADLVDHDQLTGYLAAQHLTLPNTIVAVLTDHNKVAHDALLIDADTVDGEHAAAIVTNARVKAHFPDTIANILSDHNLLAHTALGLFDASADVDHNATTNYDANRHIDHTAVSILSGGLITGGGTIDGNQTLTLTEATIETAIDTLANLTSIQGQTVTFSGSLNVEADSNVNQDVTSDASPSFGDLTISVPVNIYNLSHNSFADYAANQHVVLPNTIANVLTDHILGAHTAAIGGTGLNSSALSGTPQVAAGVWSVGDSITAVAGDLLVNNDAAQDVKLFAGAGVGENKYQYWYGWDTGTVAAQYVRLQITATGDAVFTTDSGGVTFTPSTNYFTITNIFGYDFTTDHNFWIGYLAGEDLAVGGQYNTFVGEQAGLNVTTGDDNTFVGYQAGFLFTDRTANTFIGARAGYGASGPTEAHSNVAVGMEALYSLGYDGGRNVAVGYKAAYSLDDGPNNVAIGAYAGYGMDSTGGKNIFIGAESGYTVGRKYENVVVGYYGMYDATTASYNVVIGTWAGQRITTGQYNTIVGFRAAGRLTTVGGFDLGNVAIGHSAMNQNVVGIYNVAIGKEAGYGSSGQSYSENVFVGYRAAYEIKTATANTFVGAYAGYTVDEGSNNVGIGHKALYASVPDAGTVENVAVGGEALYTLGYTGRRNVAVGYKALYAIDYESEDNVAVGWNAGGNVQTEAIVGNVFIGSNAGYGSAQALGNVIIGFQAAEDISSGDYNVIIGYMAGEGWIDTESDKLIIANTDTMTPLIYGDFSTGNITINGDFDVAMDAALDQTSIIQSSATGTEDQPLIKIIDARTGVTAQELSEATMWFNVEGGYAIAIIDGYLGIGDNVYFSGALFNLNAGEMAFNDDIELMLGTSKDIEIQYRSNSTEDAFLLLALTKMSADDSSAIFLTRDLKPWGYTLFNDWLSPTFIITNDENADANDYAGVIIGERAQADVEVAHYFDFYAMTGAIDNSPDVTTTELAAIFRFGASGSATPDFATTPGDVLFEGAIEIDGNKQVAGYNRQDYIMWNDCFDHGSTVAKYGQDWDLTALNTQGSGSNTIQTTPSHITLTTDNNAIGDNEGTRTDYAIVQRARRTRTEFSVDLGQTANTQFYCGWNTSGTNAMVAAADEYVIVFFDVSDNANWQIKVGDGTTEDVFTSAVAADTNIILHEIWVETDGTVHWRVNGTELDITGSVDNLMTANNHYLIVGQAQSVTGAAAIVAEIDFVELEKIKAH